MDATLVSAKSLVCATAQKGPSRATGCTMTLLKKYVDETQAKHAVPLLIAYQGRLDCPDDGVEGAARLDADFLSASAGDPNGTLWYLFDDVRPYSTLGEGDCRGSGPTLVTRTSPFAAGTVLTVTSGRSPLLPPPLRPLLRLLLPPLPEEPTYALLRDDAGIGPTLVTRARPPRLRCSSVDIPPPWRWGADRSLRMRSIPRPEAYCGGVGCGSRRDESGPT